MDAVVQSTDKNFMVPVGGAVVAAGRRRPGLVAAVNQVRARRLAPLFPRLETYPGLYAGFRASLTRCVVPWLR